MKFWEGNVVVYVDLVTDDGQTDEAPLLITNSNYLADQQRNSKNLQIDMYSENVQPIQEIPLYEKEIFDESHMFPSQDKSNDEEHLMFENMNF